MITSLRKNASFCERTQVSYKYEITTSMYSTYFVQYIKRIDQCHVRSFVRCTQRFQPS
jgi:hypothetical protein